MKKKAVVIIFIVILIFPMVSWPLVSLLNLPTVDENREKATFPQFGDDVFSQFDEFFADRAPYRDLLIKLYNNVARKLGLLYENMLFRDDDDGDDVGDNNGDNNNDGNSNYDEMDTDIYTEINNALFGREDWLFYTGDNSIGYYKGTNLPTEKELQDYVARAEKVNDYFKARGKEFIIFIAPNKEQIYSEYMPRGISVKNTVKRADMIYNYFKEHSNVTVLYPKKELLEAKKTHVTYHQQDTHWNNFGGWIGAKHIFENLNVALGNVTITETSCLGGDLASMAAMTPLKYTDYNVTYRPEITIKYNVSTTWEYEIESTNKNGKNLVLLGDSFRNAMREVLSKEFEESIFNHRDSFSADRTYAKEFDAASTVIFQAVERYEPTIFSEYGLLQRFINIYGL